MRTRLTVRPGHPGARHLTEIYGERLVCVRYRYDPVTRRRYKTVELIVAELRWDPPTSPASRGSSGTVELRGNAPPRPARDGSPIVTATAHHTDNLYRAEKTAPQREPKAGVETGMGDETGPRDETGTGETPRMGEKTPKPRTADKAPESERAGTPGTPGTAGTPGTPGTASTASLSRPPAARGIAARVWVAVRLDWDGYQQLLPRLRAIGARWNAAEHLCEMRYHDACALGLADRVRGPATPRRNPSHEPPFPTRTDTIREYPSIYL
jgi:hypothetical protein